MGSKEKITPEHFSRESSSLEQEIKKIYKNLPQALKEINKKESLLPLLLELLHSLHSRYPLTFSPEELIEKFSSLSKGTLKSQAEELNISYSSFRKIRWKIATAFYVARILSQEGTIPDIGKEEKIDKTAKDTLQRLKERKKTLKRSLQERLETIKPLLQEKAPHWLALLEHYINDGLTIKRLLENLSYQPPVKLYLLNERVRAFLENRKSTSGVARLAARLSFLNLERTQQNLRGRKISPDFIPFWLGEVASYLTETKGKQGEAFQKASNNFLSFLKLIWASVLKEEKISYIPKHLSSPENFQQISDEQLKELLELGSAPYMKVVKKIIKIFTSPNPETWSKPIETIAEEIFAPKILGSPSSKEKYIKAIKPFIRRGLAVIIAILNFPEEVSNLTKSPPELIFENSFYYKTSREVSKMLSSKEQTSPNQPVF
ncbi:hypothetical protein J7J95_00020 [bacterium]|nr:hypothetical protein [bacterium]